jgi:hypothetical protein
MKARFVFDQTNGEVTKDYYKHLDSLGPHGQLATALFRANKRSCAAKRYRGRGFKQAAYEIKNWSLSEICRILTANDMGLKWGWKRDPGTPGYEWVLYVELPLEGGSQVSFHSADRLAGPDFSGEYDGARLSTERILQFCDAVYKARPVNVISVPTESEAMFA